MSAGPSFSFCPAARIGALGARDKMTQFKVD
jgi:hypothetical protein